MKSFAPRLFYVEYHEIDPVQKNAYKTFKTLVCRVEEMLKQAKHVNTRNREEFFVQQTETKFRERSEMGGNLLST